MMDINLVFHYSKLIAYLSHLFQKDVNLQSLKKLGTGVLGVTYFLDVELTGQTKSLVLKVLDSNGFGQDFPADRACTLIYAKTVYNTLHHHVSSYDVGAVFNDGSLM
jgi:hypothetical protein